MKKKDIWIADLTHTAQGISANTFPLGASFVYSYAKLHLDKEFDFKLFKFPKHLSKALNDNTPAMLCFSAYSWNFELSYIFASLAKEKNPELIIIFGGPNFPTEDNEKIDFLKKRPFIDFFIELEGEYGFVDIIKKLSDYNFNFNLLKDHNEKMINTTYSIEDTLISGSIDRIKDINTVPSPYLNGSLDEFFKLPLVPMIETTRGCPFSCTFCADGLASKNKVHRYDHQRTKDELEYIAKRVKNIDELIVTDLNFGMYKQDLITAKELASIQKIYSYPKRIDAASGKNMPKRIIEVTNIIKGWSPGASIQSSDPEVLKAIKRDNLSTEAYKEQIDYVNNLDESKSESEIILGMPNDTKEKHFESLRFGVDNNVTTLRMFQAMLLVGTEMASINSRKQFGLKTKFRTIPGTIGYYNIYNKDHSVAEIEEIIVGNNSFKEGDYLECRIMNLLVATFYNNSMFGEVFDMLRAMNISGFDLMIYMKEHTELYSERVKNIIKIFEKQTTEDLFDSWKEANDFVLDPKIIGQYIGGDMGTNELLVNRALLFDEFEDVNTLLFNSVIGSLKEKGLYSKQIEDYLLELKIFLSMRKKDPLMETESVKSAMFKYDFEKIGEAKYRIDPRSFPALTKPIKFNFFHNKDQQQHISNQMKLYSNHAIPMGKLLQNTNLNIIFRSFNKSSDLLI